MQMTMSSGQLIYFLSGYEVLGGGGAMYPNINNGRGWGVTVMAMSPKIVRHLKKRTLGAHK